MRKNFLFAILLMIAICFSACNNVPDNSTDNTSTVVPEATNGLETTTVNTTVALDTTTTTTTDVSETTTILQTTAVSNTNESAILPLPDENTEFSFLSGAGAWRTMLTLNKDGTFSGFYLDSEMGVIGEGYPKGSAYICNFLGKFDSIEKVNEYSYKMTLTELKTEKTTGEEWIEDGIRYIASEPYGLDGSKEFILYLPHTPITEVSEEFLSWWPYRYGQQSDPKETLSCYGILNVATQNGFFNA